MRAYWQRFWFACQLCISANKKKWKEVTRWIPDFNLILYNLLSLISINLDVKARNWNGHHIERNNNGMISSLFICYHCVGILPFYICISLEGKKIIIIHWGESATFISILDTQHFWSFWKPLYFNVRRKELLSLKLFLFNVCNESIQT